MGLTLVTATRSSRDEFLARSPLAQSARLLAQLQPTKIRAFFDNREPLGLCYNQAIAEAAPEDILLFVHDDVCIDDWLAGRRLEEALQHFDVVGIAGNRRRQAHQETWYMKPGMQSGARPQAETLDYPWLSGSIMHGHPGMARHLSEYGPSCQPASLLDGVFLAACAGRLRAAGVGFDPALGFHFYDLDFCRSAGQAGLSIGTWPIAISHASQGGSARSAAWAASRTRYFAKWGD